jgi:predicted nucleic acid-binding protein
MVQTVFLDTNIVLDYLENRNLGVRDAVAQLLLLHKKGRLVIATSVFNVVELIDKEFEIGFIIACVGERMSYDEIIGKVRKDRKLYRQIAEKNKNKVERAIRDFIFQNKIEVFPLRFDAPENYEELYKLIYDYQLKLEDALIVATAVANGATYFLSNDSDLVNVIGDLLHCYNLRDNVQREIFHNGVLEAV